MAPITSPAWLTGKSCPAPSNIFNFDLARVSGGRSENIMGAYRRCTVLSFVPYKISVISRWYLIHSESRDVRTWSISTDRPLANPSDENEAACPRMGPSLREEDIAALNPVRWADCRRTIWVRKESNSNKYATTRKDKE
jgi:hypothetical protein